MTGSLGQETGTIAFYQTQGKAEPTGRVRDSRGKRSPGGHGGRPGAAATPGRAGAPLGKPGSLLAQVRADLKIVL